MTASRIDSVFTAMMAVLAAAMVFAGSASASGPEAFEYRYEHGPAIKVWAFEPSSVSAATKVIFVMHGVRRNGEDYRDQWAALAESNGFLLITPEFAKADFSGAAAYNLGGVFDDTGAITPTENWTYSYIEPLFDAVRARYRLKTKSYAIYGHSAGAQFVHRFALYKPEARVSAIVVANAGWYEMPDYEVLFPYGLKDAAVSPDSLDAYLEKPIVVLLGEDDIDPNHPSLRRTPEAAAQGATRFERGEAFFAAGRRAAAARGARFGWSLATVPGVAHDNSKMAPHAVEYLLAD